MNFSFDAIKSRLYSELSKQTGFSNIVDYSAINILIEIFAKESAELANKANFDIRETRWRLARNISSLMLQAQNLNNYVPHRKVSAKGKITLSVGSDFNTPAPETVFLPKYTIISSLDDPTVKVCTIQADTIPQGQKTRQLDIIQGTPVQYTFTAKGNLFEEITIDNANLDNDYLEVIVGATTFTKVSSLITETGFEAQNFNAYEVYNKIDYSGITIRFGNGVFGTKLSRNTNIIVNAIETLGSNGNTAKKNVFAKVETSLFDINSSPVQVYAKNEAPVSGGLDYESKESIQANAPKVFQSGDRASTKSDYLTILKKQPEVFKATVWGEYEYLIDKNLNPGDQTAFVPLQENKIHICAFNNSGLALSSTEKDSIIASLNQVKSPTDIIEFNDAEVVFLNFVSKLFVKERSYNLTNVKTKVVDKLINTYSINNFEFGNSIFESDYKGLIDSIEGIDHNITKIRLVNYFTFDQASSCSFNLSLHPVKKSITQNISVKVSIANPLTPNSFIYVGQDSLANDGTFITDTTIVDPIFDLTNSAVSYTNGQGVIFLSGTNAVDAPYGPSQSFLNFILKIEYEIDALDFELKKRNQIFRYEDSNVDISYMV